MCPLFDPFRWACVVCVLYVQSNVLRINFFSCPAQSTEVKLLVVILVAGGVCKFDVIKPHVLLLHITGA